MLIFWFERQASLDRFAPGGIWGISNLGFVPEWVSPSLFWRISGIFHKDLTFWDHEHQNEKTLVISVVTRHKQLASDESRSGPFCEENNGRVEATPSKFRQSHSKNSACRGI